MTRLHIYLLPASLLLALQGNTVFLVFIAFDLVDWAWEAGKA